MSLLKETVVELSTRLGAHCDVVCVYPFVCMCVCLCMCVCVCVCVCVFVGRLGASDRDAGRGCCQATPLQATP